MRVSALSCFLVDPDTDVSWISSIKAWTIVMAACSLGFLTIDGQSMIPSYAGRDNNWLRSPHRLIQIAAISEDFDQQHQAFARSPSQPAAADWPKA
jgi:hypothetical protein